MNSNVTNPIIKMEASELSELVAETKETVAINVNGKTTFSAADLWNIRRSMRSAQKRTRQRDIGA